MSQEQDAVKQEPVDQVPVMQQDAVEPGKMYKVQQEAVMLQVPVMGAVMKQEPVEPEQTSKEESSRTVRSHG